MRTVILVPRRDGFPDRDRTWAWVRSWWRREFPELELVEGHHDGPGPFNRSAALNTAARLADDWDVAVIIDSDILVDPGHVREAIETADREGRVVVPFTLRYNLNQKGSTAIMAGDTGDWRRYVARTYHDQHSSCLAVPRSAWDTVGGFDTSFAGWGFEDTAWACAITTLVGPLIHMPGECWHLYHPSAPEGHRSPAVNRNRARGARYQAALGDAAAIRALLAEDDAAESQAGNVTSIPRLFHRVVPEHTTAEVEGWWQRLQELHPGWRFMTHRDPLDPADWPETAASWRHCRNGASLADLVRLEALWRWGGVYLDSDVEPYRSFAPLLPLEAFAAWEDRNVVPNAVMGARPGHPAIRACLDLAKREVRRGTWEAGPGVTTKVLVGRDDVLLLPPGSFFPYSYKEKERRGEDHMRDQPWSFCAHHWAGSWLVKAAG